ncbi:MAG: hypothetical protein U9N30_10225 [Campylobacterota bacterium]|nr:hypothetical protein [Campylobacterota bacterium]
MILLALFGLIVAVVMGLSFYDDYHISQIEKYYEDNQCKALSHYHGKYQAVCGNNIVMYQNSFSLDMEKPTLNISLSRITKIEDQIKQQTASTNAKRNMLITLNKQQVLFEFENMEKLNEFKGALNK